MEDHMEIYRNMAFEHHLWIWVLICFDGKILELNGKIVQQIIWVNYNDLTTSLEIMISKGNHPQMALIQISELL